MRKIFAFLLSVFIISAQSSFGLNIHYCKGVIAEINWKSAQIEDACAHDDGKACCKKELNKPKKSHCCKDEQLKKDVGFVNDIQKVFQSFVWMNNGCDWNVVEYRSVAFCIKNKLFAYSIQPHAPPRYLVYKKLLFYA